MKAVKIILIAALVICSLSSMALAADSSNITQRLCLEGDLTGRYLMVDFRETPASDETSWHKEFPYHYLAFYPAHSYGFLASRRKLTKPGELEKSLALSAAEGMHLLERTYTLDKEGVLDLYVEKNLDYSCRCMIVTKAVGGDQVGDIMLTGYSKRQSQLYKLFRRVE